MMLGLPFFATDYWNASLGSSTQYGADMIYRSWLAWIKHASHNGFSLGDPMSCLGDETAAFAGGTAVGGTTVVSPFSDTPEDALSSHGLLGMENPCLLNRQLRQQYEENILSYTYYHNQNWPKDVACTTNKMCPREFMSHLFWISFSAGSNADAHLATPYLLTSEYRADTRDTAIRNDKRISIGFKF